MRLREDVKPLTRKKWWKKTAKHYMRECEWLRKELEHHNLHVTGYPSHTCRPHSGTGVDGFVCCFCGRTCL